ncbi:hypothetical protein OIU79_029152 [Salix purpurea]|uniref:Uncharacterized protein n=1 Tax=Salix purpurea TaxID=77065 RepID=A0A9Q0VFU1_SALPP|nr:hypothetical protein OIU79_029152 [Salix purpurea]
MRSLSVLLPSLPSSSAADSLQLKPLVDLTSCALSRTIEGKTPAAFLRETFLFNLNVDVEEEHADDCSVEDLLSFINEEDGGLSRTPPPSAFPNDEVNDILAASPNPAMTEELDREVEDFARRLNSDWPERMQEILSLDPERRLAPLSMNGNRYSGYFVAK